MSLIQSLLHFVAGVAVDPLNQIPAFRERMIGKYITRYSDDVRRQWGHIHDGEIDTREHHSRIMPMQGVQEFEFGTVQFPPDVIPQILKLKAQQPQQERLGLYALVAGLQPTAMLEIGSAEGGSASIAVKAMDAINKGRLFCIEPHPKIEPEVWAAIEHRATLIEGFSPYVTPEVARMAKAPFDLVFIDGYHNEEQVGKDIDGCLPFLADTAYLLFHDSYNDEVRRGVDAAIQRHPTVLQDCGIIFRARSFFYDDWWCGMRLVAYSQRGFLEVRS